MDNYQNNNKKDVSLTIHHKGTEVKSFTTFSYDSSDVCCSFLKKFFALKYFYPLWLKISKQDFLFNLFKFDFFYERNREITVLVYLPKNLLKDQWCLFHTAFYPYVTALTPVTCEGGIYLKPWKMDQINISIAIWSCTLLLLQR